MFLSACTFGALEIGWLARGLRFDLIPQAQAVVQKASTTIDNGNAAIRVQESYWSAELQETRKATADLHDLIIHTDLSLNGRHEGEGILGEVHANIIPHLVAVLDASNTAIIHVAADVDRVGGSTDAVVGKVGKTVDALNVRIEDPTYNEILANASQSMKNLNQMSADGTKMTGDAAAFLHRELAPVRGVKNTIKAGLDWAYKIRQLIF